MTIRSFLQSIRDRFRPKPQNDCNLSGIIDYLEATGHKPAAAELRALKSELDYYTRS